MTVAAGKPAPDFSLQTDTGDTVSLKDFKGKPVVLYFYPKDNTPGCTKESCDFRDLFPRFERGGAVILGISPDSVKKHQNFKKKYKLPFTLLADVGHKVADEYGLWVKKQMFGVKYMGVERTTYIIGPDGRIERIFAKVNPLGHAEEVAAALQSGR